MPDLTAEAPLIAWNHSGRTVERSANDSSGQEVKYQTLTVHEREERGADHRGEPGDSSNCALFEDAGRYSSVVSLPELNDDENDEQNGKNDQQRDDTAVRPWVLRATPLKSEKKADDHRQEDDGSINVELLQILAPTASAEALCARLLSGVVEEGDECERDGTNGKVDCESG